MCLTKIAFSFSLALLCSISFAQDKFGKGYYINQQQDTVNGFIQYRENFLSTFTFRKDLNTPKEELGGTQSSAFGFNGGNKYRLVNFADQQGTANRVYARVVIDGSIDLYVHFGKLMMGSEEKKYFVFTKGRAANESDQLSLVQKNQGALNILFSDCPTVMQKSAKTTIGEAPFATLLSEYHSCKSLNFKHYQAQATKKISFGVYTTLNLAKLSFDGNDESLNATTFDRSVDPGFGAMMLIRPSRKHSSIFYLQLELVYNSMHYKGNSYLERSVSGFDFKYTGNVTADFHRISPRVGFRLSGRSNKLNPYVIFGVTGPSIIASKSQFTKTVQINDATEVYESEPFERLNFSWWIGAGLKKPFRNGSALFIDGVFESVVVEEGGEINMLSPRLGFLF